MMLTRLKGYKTYAFAILYGVTSAAEMLGYVGAGTADKIKDLSLAGALWSMRAGIKAGPHAPQ
jgi:hypothetical protein